MQRKMADFAPDDLDEMEYPDAVEIALAPEEQKTSYLRSFSAGLPSMLGLSQSIGNGGSKPAPLQAQMTSPSFKMRSLSPSNEKSSMDLSAAVDGKGRAKMKKQVSEAPSDTGSETLSDAPMSFTSVQSGEKNSRAAQFIQDFLFTDIMNHCEFLKWIQTLDKSDDLLLVHLFERIRTRESIDRKPIEPFYENHANLARNPFHIAKVYTALQELQGHQFNIFEQTYLNPNKSYVLASILALSAQVGLLIILMTYHLKLQQPPRDIEWTQLIVVAVVSSIIFLKKGEQHWKACHQFNSLFREMGNSQAALFLTINAVVNKFLCVVIFVFNIWFVLSSENSSDAVLNSLSLFFILEIDDELVTDWDRERAEDEMAINVHDYIMIKFAPAQLRVTNFSQDDENIRYNFSGVREYSSNIIGDKFAHDRLQFYTGQEKLYIQVEEITKDGGTVAVYKAERRENGTDPFLTTTYKRIAYTLRGTNANEFLHIVQKFKCIHNFYDIHG
jgi:hypothetical protein